MAKKIYWHSGFLFWMIPALLVLLGCSSAVSEVVENTPTTEIATVEATPVPSDVALADVIAVAVTESALGYQFSVEVRSPDEGCDQYADWWEVLTEDGTLLYRRILAHSHVGEQPFVRSGGPVDVAPDAVVWVRAHMHPGGYGGQVLKGSVQDGFSAALVEIHFAVDIESLEPQPTGCAF